MALSSSENENARTDASPAEKAMFVEISVTSYGLSGNCGTASLVAPETEHTPAQQTDSRMNNLMCDYCIKNSSMRPRGHRPCAQQSRHRGVLSTSARLFPPLHGRKR